MEYNKAGLREQRINILSKPKYHMQIAFFDLIGYIYILIPYPPAQLTVYGMY